jgi:hypothetical protein
LGRLWLAIRCFFTVLFQGRLPEDAVTLLPEGEASVAGADSPRTAAAASPAPATAPAAAASPPAVRPEDGALLMRSLMQRDARLIDFLMEDISQYEDDQVGAAVRSMQEQAKDTLSRYVRLTPVIDGVEGSFAKVETGTGPAGVKLLGNIPASGKVPGGTLRHRGWKAEISGLPALPALKDRAIIAPAEIEVE